MRGQDTQWPLGHIIFMHVIPHYYNRYAYNCLINLYDWLIIIIHGCWTHMVNNLDESLNACGLYYLQYV